MHAAGQILTAAEMRAAEAALIAGGETVESLMDRAGRGAADYVFRMAAGRPVTVLCGPGNNGGDGYVIARVLRERGVPVAVVAPLEPKTAAAQAARAAWGGKLAEHADAHILVDCLFGTGLTRPLAADLARLLGELALCHDHVVAVDLPSGVDADRAVPLNPDLPPCNATIALGAWKWAHHLMPTSARMGALRLVDIGIGVVAGAGQLAGRAALAAPAADAHKYSRGLLAVIGGAMPGAALLAAQAAQHGGAGYVKLLSPPTSVQPERAEGRALFLPPDLVCETAPPSEALRDPRITARLIGPGLGRDAAARERLVDVLAFSGPLVLDADALMLLEPGMIAPGQQWVATPHAGELAALFMRFSIAEGGRVARLRSLAAAMQAVIVAKGPDSMIAAPGGQITVLPPSPSWLSTAGTGDVLAGLIASRLACGSAPERAALEGCQLHAEAARLAGSAFSASGLIRHIPVAYETFL